MKKKWMYWCLCVLLLFSLTACGGETDCKSLPLPEDADYRYGMEQLELGNLAKAYGYFKDSADSRAAEMLEHFVFVPTKSAVELSYDGHNTVTTYTYDAHGNLLAEIETGRFDWTTKADDRHTYNYDNHHRVLLHTYRCEDYGYVETYSYDEAGHTISYIHNTLNGGSRSSGFNRFYDVRGNLVREEHCDAYDEAYNYTLTYTYDDQDRILTSTHTEHDGTARTHTYVYDEEGNYQCTYVGDDHISIVGYDNKDRVIKQEFADSDGVVLELREHRYDDRDNEIYYRSLYDNRETVRTHTYDEQGHLLKSETTLDGEVYAMSTYTYDEAGNKLSYEHFSGTSSWGRESFTYNAQGHLLTHQMMGDYGWSNTSYIYDEAGNRVKGECKSNTGTITEDYTYDKWGNLLTFRSYRISDGWETATVAGIEWQVQYYPDGIPEQVQDAIDNAMSEY